MVETCISGEDNSKQRQKKGGDPHVASVNGATESLRYVVNLLGELTIQPVQSAKPLLTKTRGVPAFT